MLDYNLPTFCCVEVIGAVTIVFCLLLYFLLAKASSNFQWTGSHVVITGGSQGIGKEMGKVLVRKKANLTLIARTANDLQAAIQELRALMPNPETQKVQFFTLDISALDQTAMDEVIAKAEASQGPVDVLINNAGGPVVKDFDDIPLATFDQQMRFNYLSVVGMVKSVLPTMKSRMSGRILFVSSLSGQIGVYGYSPYAAAKFGVRGFAEALQMELQNFNISLHLGFPPATATDRFLNQADTKPEETRLLTGKLHSPELVATTIIRGVERGDFFISIGPSGWMLKMLTCGTSPVRTLMQAVEQTLLLGPLRMIGLHMKANMDRVVAKCYLKKSK